VKTEALFRGGRSLNASRFDMERTEIGSAIRAEAEVACPKHQVMQSEVRQKLEHRSAENGAVYAASFS